LVCGLFGGLAVGKSSIIKVRPALSGSVMSRIRISRNIIIWVSLCFWIERYLKGCKLSQSLRSPVHQAAPREWTPSGHCPCPVACDNPRLLLLHGVSPAYHTPHEIAMYADNKPPLSSSVSSLHSGRIEHCRCWIATLWRQVYSTT
jgi:hypothetical protein